MFYFVRHGETDYTERGTKIYQGHGTNLAPLSETGIGQIKKAAKDIRLQEANLILCSSYTRAVQSAAILSKELGLEIRIETDLHEWVANDLYIYEGSTRIPAAGGKMLQPLGEECFLCCKNMQMFQKSS